MNKTDVETIGSGTDNLLVGVAALVVLAGGIGFTFFSEYPLLARLGILIGGLVVGGAIAWFTVPGKRFLAFGQDAWEETRKVTWPTRDETVKTTGAVFAFVAVMALFLFVVDWLVEKGLYDLLLGWKR